MRNSATRGTSAREVKPCDKLVSRRDKDVVVRFDRLVEGSRQVGQHEIAATGFDRLVKSSTEPRGKQRDLVRAGGLPAVEIGQRGAILEEKLTLSLGGIVRRRLQRSREII